MKFRRDEPREEVVVVVIRVGHRCGWFSLMVRFQVLELTSGVY